MKLKYYMRGLGIGICVTTLIMSFGKEKMTDQEIIKRAQELGMKTEDQMNDNLQDALGQMKLSVTPKPTSSLTPSKELSPTAKPTKAPTPTPKATPIANNQKISFTIQKGMSSDMVAKKLKEVGLVKDSEDFNQYIIKKGKASTIRVGNYSLPKGSSYDEIIKKITS
jgi:Predicted periplasmic solute-binding protein